MLYTCLHLYFSAWTIFIISSPPFSSLLERSPLLWVTGKMPFSSLSERSPLLWVTGKIRNILTAASTYKHMITRLNLLLSWPDTRGDHYIYIYCNNASIDYIVKVITNLIIQSEMLIPCFKGFTFFDVTMTSQTSCDVVLDRNCQKWRALCDSVSLCNG